MLPAYVLGALEPDEMVAVEEYVNEHRALLRRLDELEESIGKLAVTAPHAPLPGDAKERLMARVRADVEQATVTDATAAPFLSIVAPLPPTTQPVVEPRRTNPPRRSWFRVLNPAWVTAVGAAAMLVLALTYSNQMRGRAITLQNQLDDSRGQLAQVREEAGTLQSQNAALLQQLQAEEQRLALLTGTNRTYTMAATEEAPGAGGALFTTGDEGVLVLHGLQPLPEDQTYQLWLLGDAAPVPAGLVEITDVAPDWSVLALPAGAGEYAGIAISIEPSTGSEAPTGPIVLASNPG
ncbi:MAG TPA: anti-sigma factor [Ardenticatenaceae bacterium]|jgi:anti-sigma factor RsiW